MDEPGELHGTGSASDSIPPDEPLPVLRDAVQHCQGCGLYAFATQAVYDEGPSDARAAIPPERAIRPAIDQQDSGACYFSPEIERSLDSLPVSGPSVRRTSVRRGSSGRMARLAGGALGERRPRGSGPSREWRRPSVYFRLPWGCSSAGRALRSHRRGQGFESPHLHHSIR